MSYKIGFISLGCPKNQVDAELMLAKLEATGMEIAEEIDHADAVIVHTCAFIDSAKEEAIENILNMVSLREEGLVGKVIVTGCLAQRHQDEIFEEIPEVDAVFGIGANGDIAALVEQVLGGEKQLSSFPPPEESPLSGERTLPSVERVLKAERHLSFFPTLLQLPLSGQRILSTPPYWAYLKIAEGCSNCCAYCVIPEIRGPYRSRPMEDILEEAAELVEGGVKELILVAQDTTNYGMDLGGTLQLPELLKRLSAIEGLVWIRLLYCYPDKITNELLEVIADNKKILHYIDLPLQHINDRILLDMRRRGNGAHIRETIARIRAKLPDVVLRTTLITGFPGETEEEFEELVEFINETEFDRLGCFAFSPQEGTSAYTLPEPVEDELRQKRAEILMQDQYEIMALKNRECIGKTYLVLAEGYDAYSDSYYGRSYRDAPEIDTLIRFTGKGDYAEGTFVSVEIFGENDSDLIGRVAVS